ncbi:excalibur calcium-binding domain-containing protein (plasmid) [Variovorax sp. 375MFSha3.1]
MTSSCIEAKFFLKNCPGTQMDRNHDGVPCEQQWWTGLLPK